MRSASGGRARRYLRTRPCNWCCHTAYTTATAAPCGCARVHALRAPTLTPSHGPRVEPSRAYVHPCGVVRWRAPHVRAGTLTQAIESSCQPPQRHGNNGDEGDGDHDTVGTGKRVRGLATQWHPHDEQQRAPIVNHVLEGNVQQVRQLRCVPSLPLSPRSRSRARNPNARETLALARQAMELLEQSAPGLLAKHPEVRRRRRTHTHTQSDSVRETAATGLRLLR